MRTSDFNLLVCRKSCTVSHQCAADGIADEAEAALKDPLRVQMCQTGFERGEVVRALPCGNRPAVDKAGSQACSELRKAVEVWSLKPGPVLEFP